MPTTPEYFLFVGSVDSESATTQLRADNFGYRKKMLNSRSENWERIITMVRDPQNRGTLMVLSGRDYERLCNPSYQSVAIDLLDALKEGSHIVFVHNAVFFTEVERFEFEEIHERTAAFNAASGDDEQLIDLDEFIWSTHEYFSDVADDTRQRVNAMLRERDLDIITYQTNAERSIVARSFIEDNQSDLLFRLYVPSGRLYAQEAETLLTMFRQWLGQTGRARVRQDGYSTAAGQVFEFYSTEHAPAGGIQRDLEEFSRFLENCVSSPEIAVKVLTDEGITDTAARLAVSNYSTRARRFALDMKQSREAKLVTIKHEYEQLLLEIEGRTESEALALIEALVPPSSLGQVITPGVGARTLIVNHNPQFINSPTGSVVQNIAGTVHLNQEARDILDLVAKHGGNRRENLETAVHELEDGEAPNSRRVIAKARLKSFLADLTNRGVGMGMDILQKYVEHKTGIS